MKFYITTPIYYVNSEPHVGSAYTTLFADLLARFYRLNGYDVKFLTGTDEHGQKIEQSANRLKENPQKFVDDISQKFRDLVALMQYTPDYFETIDDSFIRTTKDCHKKFVQDVWAKMVENGWLYKGSYEGWYCVSDEAYYTEDELVKGDDGKYRTDLGKEAEWRKESTYFFRLGEFQKVLLEVYEKFPNLVQPYGKKTEVISFVSGLSMKDYQDGKLIKENHLQDLSVSRNSFSWGIKIPCDETGKRLLDDNGDWLPDVKPKDRHVIYVWFDALFNYLTALGCGVHNDYKNYWLDNKNKVHLIGKDILRPHAVYWPAFLLAFNYTRDDIVNKNYNIDDFSKVLPTKIYAHGWLTNEGQKISKSLGNSIVPSNEIEWLVNDFNIDRDIAIDYLKYYLITTTNFGNDGDYSRARFMEKINSDLSNNIGNLTKRTLDMIYKNCEAKVPNVSSFDEIATDNLTQFQESIENFDFNGYISLLMKIANDANKYMDEKAPWKLKKEEKFDEMNSVLYSIANVIKKIAILLHPIVPNIAQKILLELGYGDGILEFKDFDKNITAGQEIKTPSIITPRLQMK